MYPYLELLKFDFFLSLSADDDTFFSSSRNIACTEFHSPPSNTANCVFSTDTNVDVGNTDFDDTDDVVDDDDGGDDDDENA
jgi:hypothetical protein